MKHQKYTFSQKTTDYYFDADFNYLEKLVSKEQAVLITDEHIFKSHQKKFKNWSVIVLEPGEEYKVQSTIDTIIQQLIAFEADRKTWLLGVGGGVVTDLAGYVATVYMRGIRFGFIPTSLLAMVDASIGGKNGIDVGIYKNLVGSIRQPEFLLYEPSFLKTLPGKEWINGFAEIIKHACIRDARLFSALEQNNISFYQKDSSALSKLIYKNVGIKSRVVQKDEYETGERRLLNFGHTIGHAIENLYELSHGEAIAIGMVCACRLSEKISGFKQTGRVIKVLKQYGLPSGREFDKEKAFEVLKMDKKKERSSMNYVLLKNLGNAFVHPIPMDQLKQLMDCL